MIVVMFAIILALMVVVSLEATMISTLLIFHVNSMLF